MARYIYQGTFKDHNGAVVGSATTADSTNGTISVYLAGTSTAASVYTASSGGTAVNSVSTDSYGYFYFWVDTTDYAYSQKFKITLSHSDFTSKTYDDIAVLPSLTYTPSGTGAVATDFQSKLRERISPEDFGAVGDGTTDDSGAIQLALNHAVSTGATIYFQNKTYACDSVLTLVRDDSGEALQFYIRGNGAKLDFSSSALTTGTLLTVGGTWGTSVTHEKGFIRISDLMIYGPEDTNPASASTADTDIIGLLVQGGLNVKLDNVHVRRCYIGIKTNIVFHLHASRCNFCENWINGFIGEISTLAQWDACDFHEGRFGLVIQAGNSNNIFNQLFNQARFETLKVGVHIDPGTTGDSINGVTFVNPYFESITYDLMRVGTEWAFSTDPSSRGSNQLGTVRNLYIKGGTWEPTSAWGATHKPLALSGSANMIGGIFECPFGLSDVVNPTNHVGGANSFTFGADQSGTTLKQSCGIGEGFGILNGTGTPAWTYAVGNLGSTITDNGTGDYTIALYTVYAGGDDYVVIASTNGSAFVQVADQAAGSFQIQIRSDAGALADFSKIYIWVKGRI